MTCLKHGKLTGTENVRFSRNDPAIKSHAIKYYGTVYETSNKICFLSIKYCRSVN